MEKSSKMAFFKHRSRRRSTTENNTDQNDKTNEEISNHKKTSFKNSLAFFAKEDESKLLKKTSKFSRKVSCPVSLFQESSLRSSKDSICDDDLNDEDEDNCGIVRRLSLQHSSNYTDEKSHQSNMERIRNSAKRLKPFLKSKYQTSESKDAFDHDENNQTQCSKDDNDAESKQVQSDTISANFLQPSSVASEAPSSTETVKTQAQSKKIPSRKISSSKRSGKFIQLNNVNSDSSIDTDNKHILQHVIPYKLSHVVPLNKAFSETSTLKSPSESNTDQNTNISSKKTSNPKFPSKFSLPEKDVESALEGQSPKTDTNYDMKNVLSPSKNTSGTSTPKTSKNSSAESSSERKSTTHLARKSSSKSTENKKNSSMKKESIIKMFEKISSDNKKANKNSIHDFKKKKKSLNELPRKSVASKAELKRSHSLATPPPPPPPKEESTMDLKIRRRKTPVFTLNSKVLENLNEDITKTDKHNEAISNFGQLNENKRLTETSIVPVTTTDVSATEEHSVVTASIKIELDKASTDTKPHIEEDTSKEKVISNLLDVQPEKRQVDMKSPNTTYSEQIRCRNVLELTKLKLERLIENDEFKGRYIDDIQSPLTKTNALSFDRSSNDSGSVSSRVSEKSSSDDSDGYRKSKKDSVIRRPLTEADLKTLPDSSNEKSQYLRDYIMTNQFEKDSGIFESSEPIKKSLPEDNDDIFVQAPPALRRRKNAIVSLDELPKTKRYSRVDSYYEVISDHGSNPESIMESSCVTEGRRISVYCPFVTFDVEIEQGMEVVADRETRDIISDSQEALSSFNSNSFSRPVSLFKPDSFPLHKMAIYEEIESPLSSSAKSRPSLSSSEGSSVCSNNTLKEGFEEDGQSVYSSNKSSSSWASKNSYNTFNHGKLNLTSNIEKKYIDNETKKGMLNFFVSNYLISFVLYTVKY